MAVDIRLFNERESRIVYNRFRRLISVNNDYIKKKVSDFMQENFSALLPNNQPVFDWLKLTWCNSFLSTLNVSLSKWKNLGHYKAHFETEELETKL